MKNVKLRDRMLSLLLAVCILLSLIPMVATPEVKAADADAIAEETASLVSSLTTSYNSLLIPVNKKVNVTSSTYSSLDGTYFMLAWNGASTYRVLDVTTRGTYPTRITDNSTDSNTDNDNNQGKIYKSAAVTISGTAVSKIGGADLKNLNYAFELQKNTETITRNTTTQEFANKGTANEVSWYGWAGRLNWEYDRANSWSKVDGTNQKFGSYLKIAWKPTASKPGEAYNIKTLHPSYASKPWLTASPSSEDIDCTANRFPFFFIPNTASGLTNSTKIYKMDHKGNSTLTYWLGWDNIDSNNYIGSSTISMIVREDRNQAYTSNPDLLHNKYYMDWVFYRISDYTLDLYKALNRVKSVVTGGNADGKYPAELYLEFLRDAQTAMNTYKDNYTVYQNSKDNTERIKMDTMAEDLVSFAELLTLESDPNSYADIPVEVFDFRADGFMFENLNLSTAYTLSTNAPTVNGIARPGTNETGDNNMGYVAGLIEPELVGGHIAYKESVVEYIANAISVKHHTFADTSVTFNASKMDTYYNKTFMDIVINGILKDGQRTPMTLGDYNSTLTKTENGMFTFDEVETYFDLAYYMLTYIWQEAPTDDIVETVTTDSKTFNLPYNLRVKELDTIRLVKNSKGEYVFNSDYENGRHIDSGVIFNYKSFKANDGKAPALNAVTSLGFEHPDMLDVDTTGPVETRSNTVSTNGNYGVVYHIRSAFVYYESKDLYFNFSGDDDVYFFINNELVCEIGGMHSACTRSRKLNGAVAQDLGLEDGDICTFDMYLADRKSTGINLNFQTNIEMMSTSAITEKVQYNYTEAGKIGTEILEGSVVPDNTEVGYGFKLLNRCEHGIGELTFADNNLGVSLTSDAVTLGSAANAEDLIFVYSTYEADTGALCTDAAQDYDYETLYPTLAAAVDDFTSTEPLTKGVYRITGLDETQIEELMRLGVPAGAQIAIYGFHRTVLASVGGYTNVVYTTCLPIEGRNTDGTYAYKAAISGSASRSLNVQNMDTVTAQPLRIVLDYGKPVTFAIDDLLKCLTYDSKAATVEFMGIRASGLHGNISFSAPSYLGLSGNESHLSTTDGNFDRTKDTIRYTPHGIMEDISCVYATVRVADVYLNSDWYLTVGIEFIPANITYYEAEELADSGEITYEEKTGDTVKSEVTVLSDAEDHGIFIDKYDPTYDQDVIFFGFEKSDADAIRYSENPIYGGLNFDMANSWTAPSYGIVGGCGSWDGALQIKTQNTSGTYCTYRSNFNLKYVPSADDWIEVRMKIVSGTANDGANLTFCPEFHSDAGSTYIRTRPSVKVPASYVGKGYFTLKFPIGTTSGFPTGFEYTDINIVRAVAMTFEGITKNAVFNVCVDYFYVGPEEKCPSAFNSDSLYFGFDNTAADQYRYTNPIYGSNFNYDKAPTTNGDDWVYTTSRVTGVKVENSAMVLTSGTAGGTNSNSPYIQSSASSSSQASHDYPTTRAEMAQVKLKFSDMTTDIDAKYEFDHAVARLGFVLDDDTTYEDSACWVDWDVTEEQLNGCDYMTLTADIDELLAAHNAKKITAVRLTIINAAGISGKTGTVSIDEIYVGPKPSQSLDAHIAAPESVPKQHPLDDRYTPNYEDRVLYFGFDNTTEDQNRYTRNSNYGGKNFDQIGNWWVPSYGTLVGVSGGALTFKSTNTSDTWGYVGTGAADSSAPNDANKAQYPLKYKPSADDWCEIRLKVDGSLSSTSGNFWLQMESMPNSGDSTTRVRSKVSFPKTKINTGYFVLSFSMTADRESFGTTLKYEELSAIRRLNFLFTNLEANKTFTFTIDYCYIGPKETMPSKISQDRLYFDFDNSEAAQFKYAAEVFSANYDKVENWYYNTNRSPQVKIENGCLSATVSKYVSGTESGSPWFETRRGSDKTYAMNYQPTGEEYAQVRVRFDGIEQIDEAVPGKITIHFYDAASHNDENDRKIDIIIPTVDLSTNGKWFTYSIKVGDSLLANGDSAKLAKACSIRWSFRDLHSPDGTGTIDIDYLYIGPCLDAEPSAYRSDDEYTYGYDELYNEDAVYSDHRTLFAEGKGIKTNLNTANYSVYSFEFTGTGFDIISRTGKNQGSIRAMVYSDAEKTKLAKAAQAILKGESELVQIPVLSLHELPYGQYYVDLSVAAAYDYGNDGDNDIYGGTLDRGGEFCFDAIRIYDTLVQTTHDAYLKDGEADAAFVEIRNLLIGDDSFDADSSVEGAVYLDADISAMNEVHLRYKDESGNRLVRSQETNLGDFAADALYHLFSSNDVPVDAAIVTGGSIRADLEIGKFYYLSAKNVHPLGHKACVQTLTGQQLLDALEWGARRAGSDESRAFLQVSGITYEIHIAVSANVVETGGKWSGKTADAEYRVKNVTVGGSPLNLEATYNIAGYQNLLSGSADGFAMFKGTTTLVESTYEGAGVLESYAKSFPEATVKADNSVLGVNYSSINGAGRIVFVEGNTVATWPTKDPVETEDAATVNKKTEIRNYMELGPNNEVYLTQNTGVAFKVVAVGEIPASLDIGAKSVDGREVALNISVQSTPPTALPTSGGLTLTTSAMQYYSMDAAENAWVADGSDHYLYITVSNTGAGILSLTDIKYAYATAERASKAVSSVRYLRFLVDEAMRDALTECSEHEFTLRDNGELHIATCTRCGYEEQHEHAFADGKCLCGKTLAEQLPPLPMFDETLDLSMSITASAEMSVHFSIMASDVSKYENFYLQIERDDPSQGPILTTYAPDSLSVMKDPVTGEPLMYTFLYKDISAKQMGESFYATVFATDESGNRFYGETLASSIRDFLLAKLSDETAAAETKTMAVDMLRYGAAAQLYFDYNTEHLVSNALTDGQLVYATQSVPEAVDCSKITGDGAHVNADVTVGSRVELNLSCIGAGVSDPSAVKCVITDEDGRMLAELATVNIAGVMFAAKYDNVGAREMRKPITATFYEGSTAISKTVFWSVESYVAQTRSNPKSTDLEVSMVNAMLIYGDSVAAYLSAECQ